MGWKGRGRKDRDARHFDNLIAVQVDQVAAQRAGDFSRSWKTLCAGISLWQTF